MLEYHVFQFDRFYPEGGWNDHTGSFITLEEAMEHSAPPSNKKG